MWQHKRTFLSAPTRHRAPFSRLNFIITFRQANGLNVRIETNAGIIVGCHFYDGYVIAVRTIPSEFGVHHNRFDAKTSLIHIKLFQIMIANDQVQIWLLRYLLDWQYVLWESLDIWMCVCVCVGMFWMNSNRRREEEEEAAKHTSVQWAAVITIRSPITAAPQWCSKMPFS